MTKLQSDKTSIIKSSPSGLTRGSTPRRLMDYRVKPDNDGKTRGEEVL